MNYLQTLRKHLQENTGTFSFEHEGTTKICFQTPVGTGRLVHIITTRTPKARDWLFIPDYPDFYIDKNGTIYSYVSAHAKEDGFVYISESLREALDNICQNKISMESLPDLTNDFLNKKNLSLEKITFFAKKKARQMHIAGHPKSALSYMFQSGDLDPFSSHSRSLYSESEHILCLLGITTVDEIISSNLATRKLLPGEKYIYKTIETFLDNPKTMFSEEEFVILEALKPFDSLDCIYVERKQGSSGPVSKRKLLEYLGENEDFHENILSLEYKCTYIYSSSPQENVYEMLESRAIDAGFESYEAFYNKGLRIAGYENVEPRQKQSIIM